MRTLYPRSSYCTACDHFVWTLVTPMQALCVLRPRRPVHGELPVRRADLGLLILHCCSVYLLDYTGEVEVTGCTSCQIFIGARPLQSRSLMHIQVVTAHARALSCHASVLTKVSCAGPVDGPAIFSNCKDCQVS